MVGTSIKKGYDPKKKKIHKQNKHVQIKEVIHIYK